MIIHKLKLQFSVQYSTDCVTNGTPLGYDSSYLNSNLRQVNLHCQLLTAVDIWVVGLLKGSLQLMKLIGGEGGTVSSVFLFSVLFLFNGLWRPFSNVQFPLQVAHFFITFVIRENVSF